MIYSLAPMEGLTGSLFRAVHAECFGALDRYYTPFLAPPHVGSGFGKKALRELDPELNGGLDVVPQLLTKNADEFVWAAQVLAEMGFAEVNLNLGCPSGTVVAKGRGSGFLRTPDELEAFLQDVCERSPLPVSAKTRLGIADDGEYERILEVDRDALLSAYPATRHVMLGRGLLANPALGRMMDGGPSATPAELCRFHDKLFAAYVDEIGGNAVFRMKEWWFYAKFAFENPMAVHRLVRKVRRIDEYEAAVARVFASERYASIARFQG